MKPRRLVYISVGLFIAVLYTAISFASAFYIDDFNFMAIWRDSASFSDFYSHIRAIDNGRIANILSPFSTSVSPFREIFPVANGCMYAFLMVLVQRLSSGSSLSASTPMLALAWAFMIVFLPWYDYILIFDFTLNYVWTSVAIFLFVYLLVLQERRRWRPWGLAATLAVAVLAGGFHESLALSAACGLGLWTLVKGLRMSWQFYVCFSVFIVSMVLFGFSEGIVERIGQTAQVTHHLPPAEVCLIWLVCLGAIFALAVFPKGREVIAGAARSSIFPICIGIAISGYLIGYHTTNEDRVYFFANEALVIVLLLFCHKAWGIWLSPKVGLMAATRWMAAFLFVICVLQTCLVIRWQFLFSRESHEIYSMLNAEPTETVFYDFTTPVYSPRYTLGMPVPRAKTWNDTWHYYYLAKFYEQPFVSVVPVALRDVDVSLLRIERPFDSAWKVDGHWLAPVASVDGKVSSFPALVQANISLSDGRQREATAMVQPFTVGMPEGADSLVYLSFYGFDPSEIVSVCNLRSK